MADCIAITDPADSRIEPFRDIRERDLARRQGLIAEGAVVLEQLLASPHFRPTSLMILRNRLSGIAALIERVPAGVPVYVAEGPVFDAIAGFPMHRGVLAHGERRLVAEGEDDRHLAAVAAAHGTVVVAVGIANHDNMGAIFRNAAAFGAGAVLVDETSCDPLYRKAIRVSAGSVLMLPYVRVTAGPQALDRLRLAGFRCLGLSPTGEMALGDIAAGGATALFLGAEGPGLAPALMAQMQTLRIDMMPGFDSLNVATAGAIVLQRLFEARDGRRPSAAANRIRPS